MGVPTSGTYNMFGTSNTTIQGAITQGGGNSTSITDFDSLIAASTTWQFNSTYAGNITALSQVSSSCQYRGYPISTTNTYYNYRLWTIRCDLTSLPSTSYSITISNLTSPRIMYFSVNGGSSWSTLNSTITGTGSPSPRIIYLRMGSSTGGSTANSGGGSTNSTVSNPGFRLTLNRPFGSNLKLGSLQTNGIFMEDNFGTNYYINAISTANSTTRNLRWDPTNYTPSYQRGVGIDTSNGGPFGRTFQFSSTSGTTINVAGVT